MYLDVFYSQYVYIIKMFMNVRNLNIPLYRGQQQQQQQRQQSLIQSQNQLPPDEEQYNQVFVKTKTPYEEIDELVAKVKTAKSVRDYRVADVIHKWGMKWLDSRKQLLTNPIYRNTILFKYLSHEVKKHKNIECECLHLPVLLDIIEKESKERGYKVPDENELVLHLRTGDFATKDNYLSKNYIKWIQRNLQENKNIDKITVVTCFSYGNFYEKGKWLFDEETQMKNVNTLKKLLFQIKTRFQEYPLDVVSNLNVDKDIVYCVKANYFIKDRGGFSSLMEVLNLLDKKINRNSREINKTTYASASVDETESSCV